MFTGIIEAVGAVLSVRPFQQGIEMEIDSRLDLSQDQLGDSIAIDGVCLTITAKKGNVFTATASAETCSRSTLGQMRPGSKVNIERALTLSTRLGGHIVLGHVDTISSIVEKTPVGESIRMRFMLQKEFHKYVVEKGSIAVDGVSLTVNMVTARAFDVNIIPYTTRSTFLTLKGPGDRVNLEFDVLGKYVERLLVKEENKPLEDLLREKGFL